MWRFHERSISYNGAGGASGYRVDFDFWKERIRIREIEFWIGLGIVV